MFVTRPVASDNPRGLRLGACSAPVLAAVAAVCAALAVIPTTARADDPPPPDCVKPAVPASATDVAATMSMQLDVTRYKECIQAYADAQMTQARKHSAAANSAIDQFNAFVATLPGSSANK